VPVRTEVVPGTVGQVRNRAGELARGGILAFTDSDCLPAPEWLSEGVKPFADPTIGVVQGTTLPERPIERGWPATIEVTEFAGPRLSACLIGTSLSSFRLASQSRTCQVESVDPSCKFRPGVQERP
jgi:glycosyl transferase family 2